MEKEKRMIIKKNDEIREESVHEKGVKNVVRKILIGPEDGKTNIVMRYFVVLPGGHTPFHSHDFEHVVKIEKGQGIVVDEDNKENKVSKGQSLLIEAGKNHQFRNPFDIPFEFLCVIINPEKDYLP